MWFTRKHQGVPNGDPTEQIANTRFTGVVLTPPFWLDEEFFQLICSNGDTVTFYNIIPLYEDEMDFKLTEGFDVLKEKFEQHEIGFVLDIERASVVG